MERMNISSVVKHYPDRYVLVQPVERDEHGVILLADILGVYVEKRECFFQQHLNYLLNIDSVIIPTHQFDDEEEPVLNARDSAKILRLYLGYDKTVI